MHATPLRVLSVVGGDELPLHHETKRARPRRAFIACHLRRGGYPEPRMSMTITMKTIPNSPLKYDRSFEVLEQDEAETNAKLIHTLRGIQQTVYEDSGHAERAVHAKSHGILRGQLRVAEGLPTPLAQGMFAKPGVYPVVMRFSTIPGDVLDDSISLPRGLAIKIVGVDGARLPGSEGDVTQDFVLVNGAAFGKPTAKSFATALNLAAATTDKAPRLKKALSAVLRGVEKIVEAFGGKSPTLISIGGQQETHLLGDTYYSQAPLLYGDYVVKVALAPVSSELADLANTPLDLSGKPNGLRDAVVNYFRAHDGVWDLRVQFCTDLKTMPIEDASKVWPEEQSAYLSVARLHVPAQHAWSDARASAIEDGISFSPWHGLAAHRPLGSIMRVRKSAYEAAARFRAERNQRAIVEPKNLDNFPD